MMKFIAAVAILIVLGSSSAEWYDNAVFYQIYPTAFMDSNNDGIGDVNGIISKLEHLRDLGVTGAWLSPIFKSPQVDGGYDIQDFLEVDGMFGNNNDLQNLFEAAKFVGIKIILDFVPNHSSDKHQWFIESSKADCGEFCDYYVWRDCEVDATGKIVIFPTNWRSVFGGPAWTYIASRNKCYLHQFTKEQPDLNFANEKVKKELENTLVFWMDRGADGFRIDAINHAIEHASFADEVCVKSGCDMNIYDQLLHNVTMDQPESYELVYSWRKLLDKYSEDKKTDAKFLMTEAYSSIENQIKWYGNENGTVKGSHMPFNFVLITDLDKDSKAADFESAIKVWLEKMPSYGQANWVLGNHDRPRFGSRYGAERAKSLAVMTMTLPGINVVYNGEEILMVDNNKITFAQTKDPQAIFAGEEHYMEKSRDPVRTPIQWDDSPNAGFSRTDKDTWLPVNENYKTVNLKSQKSDPDSTYSLYKALIQLRKDSEILQKGDYVGAALGDFVFAFTRTHDKKTIVVAINLNNSTETVDLTKLENVGASGDVLVATDKSYKEKSHSLKSLELKGYDAVVFMSGSMRIVTSSLLMLVVSIVLASFR